MKWEKVKLGDLYTVHNGLSKGKKFFGTGFPFLSFSIVFNKWFIPEQLYDLVEVDEKERNIYSIKKGDVFITRTSETMEELGMSTVALKDYPNATYNGFTKRLRPITELLEPRFIGYYLRTPEFRGKFMAFSAMTTRASLTNDDLLSLEVPVPPLPVQQRIASILSAYDDLIENNQKQIKLLEEAAQRLYKEWFVDLRFPGHESVKIVDGVPEGWSRKQIFELGKIITGKTPNTSKQEYYGGSIPFVKIPDMHNCIYTISTESTLTKLGADKQKNNYIPENSIMVSCIGTVGLVNISSELCQTNQQINSIVLKNREDVYYLFFSMKMLKTLLDGVGSNGATMINVNKSKFSSIEILYPNAILRNKYFSIAKPYFRKIYYLSKQISYLREARDRLLPKLMNGEIEV